MLIPRKCQKCRKDYYEVNYWGDDRYCLRCSIDMRRLEEEEKKEIARNAAAIAEKYNLDLKQYADELPEEVRKYLNPKNAGRKAVAYRTEFCELLVDRAAEGKSEAEFAAEIGISQSLITHWTETRPRFKAAREAAAELRQAWLERFFRDAMTAKVPCVPSLLLRMVTVRLGWADKNETAIKGAGGEIPVVKIVERDAGFPAEKLEPTAEQLAEAGLDKAVV
jgi:transcriptional regulator with XRE-family HTH domain